LSYYLELNTNLVFGTWSTNGYTEVGGNDLGSGFEIVTNQVPTTETNQFIRLRISTDVYTPRFKPLFVFWVRVDGNEYM
jgi:hypothetical protein